MEESFTEFLQKLMSGEKTSTDAEMETRVQELKDSLLPFIPKGPIEESWDIAMVQYLGWMRLMGHVTPSLEAWMALVVEMRGVVNTAYWLGRRDERLEGMLAGVEMKGGGEDGEH